MRASKKILNTVCKTSLYAAIAIGSSAVYAQGRMGATPNAPTLTPQNGSDTSSAMRDKDFLKEASQGGLAEVQFGQLAVQKASSDDVKQFAQKMVDDHTALNNQMKPIADSLGVTPAMKLNKKNQAEYDKLNGLSGADFDKEYLAVMDKDHHKDLKQFHAEEASTMNPDLKAAVTKGTDVIKEHTEMVDKLAKDKGVPVA